MSKQIWCVFTIDGVEKCAYTIYGTFYGEPKATMEQLALEHNVEIYDLNRLLEVCGEWCSPKGIMQRYKIVNYEELEYYEVEVQNEE